MKPEEEFLKTYDEYSEKILRHIYFRVSDWKLAEDLTQETFLRTWDYMMLKRKEIKSLKTFLYKVAVNLVIDHYRGKSKMMVSIEAANEDGIEFKEIIDEPLQEKQAQFSFDKDALEKKLSELKDEYRQALIYRYIDDLGIKEISEITGKSESSIRVLIHRALKKLKEKIKNV